jgi:hypothetical protein
MGRPPADHVAMLGRTVRQMAGEFGEEWAKEVYGDEWKTAVVTGTVICAGPKGLVARRRCRVRWEDGDEEELDYSLVVDLVVDDDPAEGIPPHA